MIARLVYRCWPALFSPERVCAWCDAQLAEAGLFSRGKRSHGVCAECSRTALEEARRARQLRAQLAATIFVAALFLSGCGKRAEEQAPGVVYGPVQHSAVQGTDS